MGVYIAPVLLTLWALMAQVRRNRMADVTVLAVCSLVIVLIAGLRWYSAADYALYVEMYDDTPLWSDFNSDSISGLFGEPGYLFLTSIFKSLGVGFALFAFACALSSMLLKSVVVTKLSRHASLALCLYLCLNFVSIEFIQMRWAVATAFLSLGFCFQYQQKRKAAILSYALALAFHYFSVLFWIVAAMVTVKGYRKFYLLFVVSLLGAIFIKSDYLARFLIGESDIYALTRVARYASDPSSHVGLFSYAKLLMYPVIYAVCVRLRPSYPWKTDPLNVFLFKLSLASLSVTLLVSFLPILHFRATVIADFFAIIWILNALDQALTTGTRTLSFVGLSALYCTWYLIDVSNNINAGLLWEYETWLTALQ